ncbi:MAG: AAA family ATPase [Eubacteriales bacterium]
MSQLPNLDVHVTESNSKILSADILTDCRGHRDEVSVYPLSFSEFYSARGETHTRLGRNIISSAV